MATGEFHPASYSHEVSGQSPSNTSSSRIRRPQGAHRPPVASKVTDRDASTVGTDLLPSQVARQSFGAARMRHLSLLPLLVFMVGLVPHAGLAAAHHVRAHSHHHIIIRSGQD